MEPILPIAQPIVTFVDQTRRLPFAQLSKNVPKLSPSQIRLAIDVIQNTNNIWKDYKTGDDPESEKELHKISMILAGQEEGIPTSRLSVPLFLQPKNVQNLISTLKTNQAEWTKPLIFQEVTTSNFIKDLEGTSLKSDDDLTHQLYRDYSTLQGHLKIDQKMIELNLPPVKPTSWKELIPSEVSKFIGNDADVSRALAVCLTQAIAAGPVVKGMEHIHDPLIPDAEFYGINKYADFQLSKVKSDILLTVTTKGALGVFDEDKLKRLAVRNYMLTQVINLSNKDALVQLTIAPRDI